MGDLYSAPWDDGKTRGFSDGIWGLRMVCFVGISWYMMLYDKNMVGMVWWNGRFCWDNGWDDGI